MCTLGEAFNEPVTDLRMETYFAALRDLPLTELGKAVATTVRFGRFFPRPVELRDAVTGSTDDLAELAWVKLLSLVRSRGWANPPKDWDDPVMRRAALELYGGWLALCERLPADGPGFAFAAKQFKATYAAQVREGARMAALPPTREEARSALSGLTRELGRRGRGLPAGTLIE